MRPCPLCRFLLLAILLTFAVVSVGCAGSEPVAEPTPQQRFETIVTRADAARDAGDAEAAFELYTEALRTEGATDTTGDVKTRQDEAKRLMLARRILATNEPSISALAEYVQALEYSSAGSTESAAARQAVSECLSPYPNELKAEVASMRKAIKARKSVELPLTVRLVASLADDWTKELSAASKPGGPHYLAAVAKMDAAATAVKRAFEQTYAEDALDDLAAADKAIDAASSELKAAAGE